MLSQLSDLDINTIITALKANHADTTNSGNPDRAVRIIEMLSEEMALRDMDERVTNSIGSFSTTELAEAIDTFRGAGYAIVAFASNEVGSAPVDLIEERMDRVGREVISTEQRGDKKVPRPMQSVAAE